MSTRYTSRVPRSLLLLLILTFAGCDTISEDFNDFVESFSPPTPFEAATWAGDFNDPGKQRRGVVLLSNSYFGGSTANVKLYRLLVARDTDQLVDPLVRAAAVRALGRWGEPEDAKIIATYLNDDAYEQVRLEASKSLQRLHEDSVESAIWRRLVDEDEIESIQIELAIALGQYPSDASFQALVRSLDNRSLALNLAAADSLRVLTGENFGIDGPLWLSWYESTKTPFVDSQTFLYPTFQRKITFFEYLIFWSPVTFEKPSVPRGLEPKAPSTYNDEEYRNIGEGP